MDDFGRPVSGMELEWPKMVNLIVELQALSKKWMPRFLNGSVEQIERLLN